MSTAISNVFAITMEQILRADFATITNPGRAFTVLAIEVKGDVGANIQVRKNTAIGPLVTTALGTPVAGSAINGFPIELTSILPDRNFLLTDNIYVRETGNFRIYRTIIWCVDNVSFPLIQIGP
tara:strand:+ start:88 stop:459 length:372 start_codon:yes stop_codon:yes gene_type:complete